MAWGERNLMPRSAAASRHDAAIFGVGGDGLFDTGTVHLTTLRLVHVTRTGQVELVSVSRASKDEIRRKWRWALGSVRAAWVLTCAVGCEASLGLTLVSKRW
ncbi:MAG: hypothetical protein DRI90_05480 [Deltaproteobacteria bacterium]|nr:MAG: hypothetical protein DRI90_05480 [Deltaproteobacteria bacterium]